MSNRYLRKNLMMIAGIIELVISIFFMFYLDIVARASVYWLFAIVGTGLAGGIFTVLASNNIEDDDSVLSKWFAVLGAVLTVAYNVILPLMKTDATMAEAILYNNSIGIVFYVIMAIAVANTIFTIIPAIWQTQE